MRKKKRPVKHKQPVKEKKRHSRWIYAAAVLVLLCAAAAAWWFLRPPQVQLELPYLTARYIAVLDVDTGKFIYEEESDEPHSPASLTKLMSVSLVLDDIESGTLNWDDTCLVTPDEAYTMGSKYGMQPGEEFTVRQLVAGAVMSSGCDCIQCLVRLCADSEEDFVQRMNEKAKELKLTGSLFANATGIDAAGHYMTARDIARLARYLVQERPELLEFTAVSSLTVDGREFTNTNRLAGRDERVKGLKTGTTQIGGNNLVTYVEEDGKSYIIVLLDSNSDNTRFSETVTIINALFGEE